MNPSLPLPKNVSLRGGAGADKNEGGGGEGPPKKKCQPNVKNDAGANTKAQKKSVFFLGESESVAGRRPATPSKKNTAPPHFVSAGLPPQTDIFCPPGLFLTLGKVNCHRHFGKGGPQTDIFWRGGGRGSTHNNTQQHTTTHNNTQQHTRQHNTTQHNTTHKTAQHNTTHKNRSGFDTC